MSQSGWGVLKKGDLVDVVAPAGRPRPHTLKGVEQFLSSWGLRGRFSDDLVGKDLLCANSAEIRFKNLKKALLATDSKMIWCLRGGYGSLHLLDALDKMRPVQNKCFLGFSDITTLHTFFVQKWHWQTIHGCNIDRFALGTATAGEKKRFRDILFGNQRSLSFALKPLNGPASKTRHLRSQVVGGNLITLQAGFGTDHQLQTKGRILFLEEVGERAYKIDRVLEHMRQLGMFRGLKAMVLGQFTEGHEPNGKNRVPEYLKLFAEQQSFPVVMGLPSGHGKNQHPLPFGTAAKLSLGPKPQLTVDSGAL